MADNPRIEELRRRVQKDPASIAFAQLAEEYRRAGSYSDAIATCRSGLAIHPGYLSARVTLGRALLEMNELDAAQTELEFVLKNAPENLAAIRGVAEIHHRSGRLTEALVFYKAALALARHDPDLEQTVDEISRAISPVVDEGLSFEQASEEFMAALEGLPGGLEAALAPEAEPAFAPEPHSASVGRPAVAPEPHSASVGRPAVAPEPHSASVGRPAVAPEMHSASVGRPAVADAPLAPNAPSAPSAPDAPNARLAPQNPPALPELERFLSRIHTSRQKKAV